MKRITFCVVAFFAWAALADAPVRPEEVRYGCDIFTLCDAETDTTAACDNGSDNYVARVAGYSTQTLSATQSTATSFSCHLYASDAGYSATARQQITSTPLTASQYAKSVEAPFDYEWIECSSISGGNVTVTSLACRAGR